MKRPRTLFVRQRILWERIHWGIIPDQSSNPAVPRPIRPLKVGDRPLHPVLRAEQHREVEVRVGVVGIERNRPAQLLGGFLHPASRIESVAEVEPDAVYISTAWRSQRIAASTPAYNAGVPLCL